MSNPVTVTVSESNAVAGASVTVTVTNAAVASGAGKTIVSSGGIADLTSVQQGEVGQGTIVVTTDGYRYVYSGAGSKTDPASYVILADITPDWSALSGKPSTFAPSSHAAAHGSGGADAIAVAIGQVTGLQTALDGKQVSGSYAAASHSHAVADVTGLQNALDGKQASGSYAAAAHVHDISDVTALQSALDSRVSAAVPWTSNHSSANGSQYNVGDLVYSGGNIYRAIATNDSIPVTSTSYWALVGPGYRLSIDGADIANLPLELPATATDGDVLTYASGQWVAAAPSGGGASLPNGTASGEVLTWNGSAWSAAAVPQELPSGSLTTGYVLTWDGSAWSAAAVPQELPSGSFTTGDVLTWDGAAWNAAAPSSGGSLPNGTTSGEVLTWNGSAWSAAAPSASLPAGSSNGDVLTWNAMAMAWQAGAVPTELPGGMSDGDVLTWSASLSTWQSTPIPSQLPTNASSGDVLYWNGSSWAAVMPSTPGLPSASTGQFLTYNGMNWVAGDPLPTTGNDGDVLTYNNSLTPKWQAAAFTIADHNPSATYQQGSLVAYGDQLWRGLAGGMGNTPAEGSSYWESLTVPPLPSAMASGDVLTWNGSQWTAAQPAGGGSTGDYIRLTTDETLASTLTATSLSLQVAAGQSYVVEGLLYLSTAATMGGIDFALQLLATTSDGSVWLDYDNVQHAQNGTRTLSFSSDQNVYPVVQNFDPNNMGSQWAIRFRAMVEVSAMISSSNIRVMLNENATMSTVSLLTGSWMAARLVSP